MAVVHAAGDQALVEDVGELRLMAARGLLATWRLHDEVARVPEERFAGIVAGFVHLAEPPRLAFLRMSGLRSNMRIAQVDETWIELVDVTTGEVQQRIDAPGVIGLLGFAPGGAGLFANRATGCVRVDDAGAIRNLDTGPRPLTRCHSHDPQLFGAWGADAVAGGAVGAVGAVGGPAMNAAELFALDADGRIVASLRRESLVGAVLGAEGRRAIVVEAGGGDVLVRFTEVDLGRGGNVSDTVAVPRRSDVHTGAPAVRAVLASRDLDRVAVLDDDGRLSSFLHRRGRGWTQSHASLSRDILVDVEHDRVLQGGLGAYLRNTAGALVKTAGKATKWCFTNGTACVLVGGAVHVLDETGTHIVDGPGDLVELGPHPRGVIAVDVRDRAHVIEVA